MKVLFLFTLMLFGFVLGCGSSDNKVTAPEKFLPPTVAAPKSADSKVEKLAP